MQNTHKLNYNKYPKKMQNMQLFAFNLENLTLDGFFYTGTAREARDKYEVCDGY